MHAECANDEAITLVTKKGANPLKTTLFFNNETAQARLMLENAAAAKAILRGPESAAGCNCDRWGHPCPGCVEPNEENCSGASDFRTKQEMR